MHPSSSSRRHPPHSIVDLLASSSSAPPTIPPRVGDSPERMGTRQAMLNLGSSNRLSGGTDANGRSHTQLHLPQIDVVASLIQAVSPQSSPRKLRRDLSTASITSVQSAATVMGGHQSSWKDLHISPDRTMKHSYSVPADAVHQPMTASSSTASLVSPRRSPHRYTVSTRLYTDPYTAARLQNDSSAIVPFVPRPLTPLAKQSPLVSQWMALLAWETGNSPANVSKGIRFQRMLEALEKECIRHVAELTAEAQRDAIRRTEAQQAQKVRLIRRAELAAATLAAERSFRRQALARFGGVLAIPEADFDILPPTLEIPIQHTALICDMLEKCAGDCGRMAPLIRRIVRQLFSCTYQGVDSTYDDEKHHEEERKKFAAAAGGHASAGASISPASALPACSLSIVPYFHVAHLLNLEYHRGQSLIHRYVDTQQTMHIQGLKRSDILNGAVRRMQATLEYHVFQRWKHVVRVRQAQLKAHLNLTRRYQTSAAHMKSHFLSWLSAAQLSRRAKDDHRLREHASGMAELQLQHKHSKRDHSIVQESKKEGKEKEVGLTRETEDARRQLHFLSVQSAALESVSIHRLLDSAFELLKQGLEGLVNELEIARTLQLQDPLRILHPLRSTWEWSEVYQECDVGSIGWAGLRREEREAARAFFEGRMGGYESGLAHTQAEDEGAAQASKSAADPPSTNSPNTTKRTAKHHSTSSRSSLPATSSSPSLSSVRSSASLASHSIQPYNYTQEVELVLLWFNFHLIQAQRKIIQRKTDAGSGKGKKKKKKPTGEKRLPGLGEGDHADLDEVDFDHLEWWEQSLYAQTTDMLAEEERALEEMERKRSQGRAISQQLDPSISALSSTASQSTADAESGLRSREHYIAEFTSAEALARRVDNFTTSLQDSELMLRLLGEIAPQVADMDMLTHIDLGSRARLLIRMLEKLNPDHAGMVTSLDFVHAFSSDRVAGLLARLMVDFPGVPIQGCWFDRGDYVNRSTVKPFLMHTNVKTLEEQMASTGTRMNGVRTERNEEFEEEFGPLAQLSHEIVQLQHAIQKRARIIPVHMTELHSVLKNTLACGRRILDDAYARHDLWLSTKTRLKAFVTAIFVAHVRGRPLKLDDPRAMKEREVFCALLENPLDAVWRKQKEKEDATLRELTTSLKRQENIAQMHKVPSTGSLPRAPSHMHTPSEVPLSPRSVNNPKLQLALDRWVTTKATAATEEITAAAGAKQDDHIPATPAVEEVLPHGKPQARFWDMLEGENKTVFMIESEEAGATDGSSAAESTLKFPPPTESPLATLSFELHVCQNLLLLFYEPLKQIWSAYAQADANAASGIEGANTMNLLEFWQLVKDCGLTAPGVFTPKQVEQVFLEVFMTREEKKDKLGTMAGGTMHALHAVILDPITGVAQPPKSKDQLELSEIDFIEVLLRISYLRKWKNPQEKQAVVAEWRSFQRERVRQLEREQRERNQAKRASQEGGCEGEIDLEKDLENDLEWEGASAQGDPTAAAALSSELSLTSDPLSDTLTGKDHSFNANMHDGLNSSFFAAAGDYRESVDETYNLDFSDPSKLPSLHLGLSLRFFGLLKCRLLPKANKIDADTFRAAYKTAGVSKLFRKHGNVLRKLFFRYATLHSVKVSVLDGAQADSWANTIDYAEFGTLLKDLHLVVDHSSGLGGKEASKMLLTPEQCYSLFALAQQELHVANTAVVSKSVEKSRYGSEQLAAAEEEKQRALEKERKKREKEKAAKESKEKEANASSKKKKKRRTTSKASISSLPSPSSTNSKRSSKRATLDKPLKLTEASGSNRRSMRMSMKQEDLAKLTKRGSMQSTADAADATSEEAPAKARTPTKLTIMPSTRDSSDDDDGASIMSEDTEDGNGSEASRESSQIGSTTAALRSEKRGRRSSKRSSFSSRASATSNPAERSDPEEKDEAEKEQEDLHVDHSAIQILAPAMSDGRIMSNGAASPEAPSADVDLDAQAASTAALAGGGAAAAVLHTHSADHSEMIYPEFLEALAAIGSFRYPNPYRSAAERIEMFLDIDVLPFVPKLLKRARTEVSEELTATTKSPFY